MENDRFLRACRREPTDRTPIWMMRQAGRYMAEYRALRVKHSLLELCKTPELATQVTMQPLRLGMDAAILFADILLPLEPMGAPFEFAKGEGPVIHEPISNRAQIDKLRVIDPEDGLGYVLAAIRMIKKEVKVPLIGFAGAPFTLASYLIEGGKSAHFAKTKKLMYEAPDAWNALMEKLSEVVRRYLRKQVEAGADAVQLFDSWVGQLSAEDYVEYVQPHVRHIVQDVMKNTNVPVIHFGTGTQALLTHQRDAGGHVIGLDWRTPFAEGWEKIGHDRAVQGNMDPTVLFAPIEIAKKHAARVLDAAAGRPGHIFNLGHGILPETPVDTVKAIVDFVHEKKRALMNAVVLIAHGTVERLDDLAPFLTNIRRGHAPPPELLSEVRRRYEVIGGRSPLLDLSQSTATKLEARLSVPVRIAMRLWHPYPKDVLEKLGDEGRTRIAVVPLAQHSAKVYGDAMKAAATALEKDKGVKYTLYCAENWGQNDILCDAFASAVEARLAEGNVADTTLLFTAHSLPRFIIDGGDPYEKEVNLAAQSITKRIAKRVRENAALDVRVCFQSQGFGGGEWLGPDLKTSLEAIAKSGKKRVVVAPIGFLADHVEILYDLDIEAMQWAKDLGLALSRTRSLNDSDALVASLEAVAQPLLRALDSEVNEGAIAN